MRQVTAAWFTIILSAFSGSLAAEQAQSWQSPLTVEGAETVSLAQARQLHAKGVVFIDVRSPGQYSKRHIPKAINLSLKNAFTEQNLLQWVSKDQPFVIYCNGTHCSLSYKASEMAVSWGFTQVRYFREGARAWRLDGNPVQTGANP